MTINALNVPFIVPPYNFNISFTPPGHGVPLSQEELDSEISQVTEKILETLKEDRPDLFIAVYTALDKMSHLHWGEPELVEYYIKIDTAIGPLIEKDERVLILSDHGFTDYDRAPVQTLPKVTREGNQLKGDHHPDAIVIAKNIPFKINEPVDLFKGLIKFFNL